MPKFIQTQVPTSPWDSCNPNYQARDTGSQGFWGFRQSTQQVALMVAAGTTGLHRSKAPRVLPAATGRGGHGACRVGWPPGALQRGRLRGEEEGRQAFWQGGPTSLGTLPPSSFCFPSLPASSSHAAPALTQHQTWCRGATPRLASGSLAPVPPVHSSVTSLGVCLQQDFQMHSWMASCGQRWPTLMVFAGTAQI